MRPSDTVYGRNVDKGKKVYGTFECLNCGRSQSKTNANQKFCPRLPNGSSCKDRYWSRGTRRVSKMNIKLNTLIDVVQEMIDVVKSNQSRIVMVEEELKKHLNYHLYEDV